MTGGWAARNAFPSGRLPPSCVAIDACRRASLPRDGSMLRRRTQRVKSSDAGEILSRARLALGDLYRDSTRERSCKQHIRARALNSVVPLPPLAFEHMLPSDAGLATDRGADGEQDKASNDGWH